MSRTVCDHQWIENFNADQDAACYNDGFTYRPAEYICTKCKRTKKIKYEDAMKWDQNLLLIPLMMVALPLLGIIVPAILLIAAIKDELLSNKKG